MPRHANTRSSGSHQTHALRELRWLLLSPPLLTTAPGVWPEAVQQFTATEAAAIDHWLQQEALNPDRLTRFLSDADAAQGPTARLGRRAERLLAYGLRHGPTHRGVAAHIVLRNPLPQPDRSTLGEIDFLVEDALGGRWQWELAVKFYLCTAGGPRASVHDFVGPDRTETFAAKLHKMFAQQLRHRPPPPWDAQAWQPAAVTRGWLFYRHGEPLPQVDGLHPQHLRGRWLPRARVLELASGAWHHLPRTQWLAPLSPAADSAAGADIAAWLPTLDALLPRAQMLVRCANGAETERVFVVPDDWPARGR